MPEIYIYTHQLAGCAAIHKIITKKLTKSTNRKNFFKMKHLYKFLTNMQPTSKNNNEILIVSLRFHPFPIVFMEVEKEHDFIHQNNWYPWKFEGNTIINVN